MTRKELAARVAVAIVGRFPRLVIMVEGDGATLKVFGRVLVEGPPITPGKAFAVHEKVVEFDVHLDESLLNSPPCEVARHVAKEIAGHLFVEGFGRRAPGDFVVEAPSRTPGAPVTHPAVGRHGAPN